MPDETRADLDRLTKEIERKEASIRNWCKSLDIRLSDEETATLKLQERERTSAGTVNWATLKASFAVIVTLWGIASGFFGFYFAAKLDPIREDVAAVSGSVSGVKSALGGKVSNEALASHRSELQLVKSELNSQLEQVELADINHARELAAKIATDREKTDTWQSDFSAQFTTFRINTNDKLARIDILCSLIRQTKTEIRKLDAINNQSVSALYAALNGLRELQHKDVIAIPERPGETGRDVAEC